MDARSGELIAPDKSTVLPKPLFDALVVEDGESDGCLPNPPRADESNWSEGFCETNGPLDQLVASKADPRRWRRRLSEYARCEYQILNLSLIKGADLASADSVWCRISSRIFDTS